MSEFCNTKLHFLWISKGAKFSKKVEQKKSEPNQKNSETDQKFPETEQIVFWWTKKNEK